MHSREAKIVPGDQRRDREADAEPTGATQRARMTAQRARGPTRVTQRAREPAQSICRLTQSLREALERHSWSRLAKYLLLKRGITARLISLSGKLVWHPVVLENC